jgi:hypothetical protein
MFSVFRPIVVVLLFAVCQRAVANDDFMKGADQKRVRVLVELLASKNKVNSARFPVYPLPADYDENAQVVVYLAIQQLLAEGATGFDTLVEHLNDKRYSYTFAYPDDEKDMTVGNVCGSIIVRCVNCYQYEIHYIHNDQGRAYNRFDKGLADWWKHNRDRTLWEIQVERIDREIEFMEKVRYDKTRIPWWSSHSPEVFESRRKDNLRILREMRASIIAQKQAYRPRSLEKMLDERYDPMLGLPWPTNPR